MEPHPQEVAVKSLIIEPPKFIYGLYYVGGHVSVSGNRKKFRRNLSQYMGKALAFISRYCKINDIWNDKIVEKYVQKEMRRWQRRI